MTDHRLVYITTRDAQEARRIGRALVEARLAACVNILDPMTSIYHWEGEIAEEQETVLLAKTRSGRMDALTAKVKAMHSYDTPCVMAFPLARNEGYAPYLDWILQETTEP